MAGFALLRRCMEDGEMPDIGVGFEKRAGVPVMSHPDHNIFEDLRLGDRVRQAVEEMFPVRGALLDVLHVHHRQVHLDELGVLFHNIFGLAARKLGFARKDKGRAALGFVSRIRGCYVAHVGSVLQHCELCSKAHELCRPVQHVHIAVVLLPEKAAAEV